MTATNPVAIDSSIPELWAKLTLRDSLRAGFWAKFVGDEGARSPIVRRSELLNAPGDTIHIQTSSPLSGSGVVGDTTALEGQEEAMALAAIKVIPVYRRHAVLLNNRGVKKSIVDMRAEAKLRLAEWAQEKMDDVRFANFTSTAPMNGETYTPEFTVVGGGTTGASDVGTADLMDVVSLQIAKLDLYNNRAKPLMENDGNEFFGMVAHPNTLYNLKRNDEYRDWVREAAVRGSDNPFFKGAIAMIDGVLIFQHNNVPATSGSPDVSSNILFGAEAFVEGLDEGVTWFEKDFDYQLQHGIAFGFAFQPRRGLAINSSILFASAEAP
jgi:N4-gp56 family major capsid protein